ncbi:hypothetical protein ABT095_31865 [Kitasatospora sp. NPDC002227]|uniref:hypothetical protein n=1 Tax=Kitasatospora sp. NPDC002227 TaxID=3154773 RepID=UPI00332BB39C
MAFRALAVLVGCGAYGFTLLGAPVTLGRILGASAGVVAGGWLSMLVWALAVLLLGRWWGLTAKVVSLGVGPAARIWQREKRVVILRRVPFPRILVAAGPGPGGVRRAGYVLAAAVTLAGQAAAGWALLAVAPPFGPAASISCLGIAVIKTGQLLQAATPAASARTDRLMVGDAEAGEALRAANRSVAEARRLIDGWTDPAVAESVHGRLAELAVLMGEGRYREAATHAEQLGQDPDLLPVQHLSCRLTRARALAYLMELGPSDPSDREDFLSLHRGLRRAPGQLTSGSDLQALYHLVVDQPVLAVGEARSAAHVGSVPLRRSMAYCTLALALHRTGRTAEAQRAVASARKVGPDMARIDHVAGVLADAG